MAGGGGPLTSELLDGLDVSDVVQLPPRIRLANFAGEFLGPKRPPRRFHRREFEGVAGPGGCCARLEGCN